MKKIIIEVMPNGDTTITTQGYKGKACKEATKAFEAAFGTVISDTPTAEAYEREELHNRSRS